MRARAGLTGRAVALAAAAATAGAGAAVAAVAQWSTRMLIDPRKRGGGENAVVAGATGSTVTLTRSADSSRPGRYALLADGMRTVVGPPMRQGLFTVTRPVTDGEAPPVGSRASLESSVWLHPAQCLLASDHVVVAGQLGGYPAWYLPGAGDIWAIHVHGHGGGRARGLRAATVVAPIGLPQLLISWRNDGDAPRSEDGYYHLGADEWRDLDAAVAFATEHGARSVLLIGLSMGAAICTQFLAHSAHAALARAMIFDAPVLSWPAVLIHEAAERRLPTWGRRLTRALAYHRTGVDLAAVAALDLGQAPSVPTLIVHGTADSTAPIAASRAWAAANPALVELHEVAGAPHECSWNVAPDDYARRVRQFLAGRCGLPTPVAYTPPGI